MPFSFQPNVTMTQGGTQVAQPASVSSSVVAGVDNLMARAKEENRSIVEIALYGIFGLALLIALGLFVYMYYLSSQIDAKKAKLDSYEAQLAGYPIADMQKLSNRLTVVNDLVKSHPSINVAFLIIEASVENMVTFTKFEVHYDATIKTYKLSLSGVAPDYRTVAQQLDALKMKPYSNYLPKVTLDTLDRDATGKILFSISTPITMQGYIPETFSVMDGTTKATSPVPDASSSSSTPSTTGTSSVPVLNYGTSTPAAGM